MKVDEIDIFFVVLDKNVTYLGWIVGVSLARYPIVSGSYFLPSCLACLLY